MHQAFYFYWSKISSYKIFSIAKKGITSIASSAFTTQDSNGQSNKNKEEDVLQEQLSGSSCLKSTVRLMQPPSPSRKAQQNDREVSRLKLDQRRPVFHKIQQSGRKIFEVIKRRNELQQRISLLHFQKSHLDWSSHPSLSWKEDRCKGIVGLVLLLLLACYTLKFFLHFQHLKENYSNLLKEEQQTDNYLNRNTLEKIKKNKEKELLWLEETSSWLDKYKIVLPSERALKDSKGLQEQFQRDIQTIKEKANEQLVTLPAFFSLGLPEYNNSSLNEKELRELNKQELILFWIANHLCEYSHLKILQFDFEHKTENLTFKKAKNLGSLTIKFITYESSFQKLFNTIVNSHYYFLIENLIIENSNPNAPAHTLGSKDNSIKIILGQEQLTILMKISIIDFEP